MRCFGALSRRQVLLQLCGCPAYTVQPRYLTPSALPEGGLETGSITEIYGELLPKSFATA